MTEPTDEEEWTQPATPREAASRLAEAIAIDLQNLHAASERGDVIPLKAIALLTDVKATALGIAGGAVLKGQRSIATNLILGAELLDACGQHHAACNLVSILSWVPTSGLAAENCALTRTRTRS